MDLEHWLSNAVAAIEEWQDGFGPYHADPSVLVSDERFADAFGELTGRLQNNYPFFHPSYAGQMLKPPHPAAVAGYLAAMLINPNNHALDGGPATGQMEKEILATLAAMFGLDTHLGHLTTSGTIANLEALYVARETHPGLGVAYSEEAHYTHRRMCGVLGIEGTPVRADAAGRMDPGALDELLAGQPGEAGLDPAPWRAIADCDSVVVDPHKHGLQPYGCGAILFKDPEVGRFYLHDSPYTYFTSDELHLGEISLECSRAGAAAAALWLTFQLLPPAPDGLGRVLAQCRRAALDWAALISESRRLELYQPPELDIVCYYPVTGGAALSAIDAASVLMLANGMKQDPPVFLSTLRVTSAGMSRRHPGIRADRDGARILRSVLMKPEARGYVPELHARVERLAAEIAG